MKTQNGTLTIGHGSKGLAKCLGQGDTITANLKVTLTGVRATEGKAITFDFTPDKVDLKVKVPPKKKPATRKKAA